MVVKEVSTEEEFNAIIAEESKTVAVVVDFYAQWCGPCKMISPEFAKMVENYTEKIKAYKVDVDVLDGVAAKCEIKAMPTFLVYKDGKKVDEMVGANKDKLRAMIEKYI